MGKYSKKQEEAYDAKMAYNKSLTPKARLRYLENDRTHHHGNGPSMREDASQHRSNLLGIMPLTKHMSTPVNMGGSRSAFAMADLSGDGKTTMKDVLIGRGVLNKDGSPTSMCGSPAHKQGYNAKLDESLAKDGKESTKKQSMKDRRDESKGMEKSKGKGAYSSDPKMS